MIYHLEQFTVESDIPCSLHDGIAFLLDFSLFLLNWWNIHIFPSYFLLFIHQMSESSLIG